MPNTDSSNRLVLHPYNYGFVSSSEIRCIRLEERRKGQHQCTLHKRDRASGGFTALSYELGNRYDSKSQVVINRDYYVRISKNLHKALTALEELDDDSISWYLFIDPISIEKEDLGEKAVQVAKMAEVYQYADRVITFLGDGWLNVDGK